MPLLHRLRLLPLIALLSAASAAGAIYESTVGDTVNRSLRLNIPDELTVVRGILIWGNGASGDSRSMAEDAELVAFARSIGFCVLATGYWGNFSDAAQAELNTFTQEIVRFAGQSGHPELINAPWLPTGHSNGGQMSYGLNALRPERVIAMVVSKGGYYVTSRPSLAALRTPGLLVAGEADTSSRRAAIRDLFEGNRPRGALWAWVEEEATTHAQGDSAQLIRPFIAECVRLRLPADADPRNGPVTLRDLAEDGGWLLEPGTDKNGFARIFAYGDYTGDRRAADWLPTERLAVLFRAFASYRKASLTTAIEGPVDTVVAHGENLVYRIGRPSVEWQSVEVYEGATAIARFTPVDAELVTHQRALRSGYLCFHAVITNSDGTRHTTVPRRVFVQSPAGPVFDAQPASRTATALEPTTLTSLARQGSGEPVSAYRWTQNGAERAGATQAVMTIAQTAPADTGIYVAIAGDAATTSSSPAIFGLLAATKVSGAAREIGPNITPRPDGYTYDQVLLEGAAAAITADPGQITRISFVDLSDDIVQVEFSGAGTLSLCLDDPTGPAMAQNYQQPAVAYMKGHARIVIAGADETTNLSVFSVGRLTALNPSLFKSEVRYDGMADIASVAIISPTGRFGGVRTANTSYFAAQGLTGVYAPGVRFLGPVLVGDLSAADAATPVLVFGAAPDTRIAGGDLTQSNARPVVVRGITRLRFVDGTNSHGLPQPAQPNHAEFEDDGLDVTQWLTSGAASATAFTY